MPCLKILTNVATKNIPAAFSQNIIPILARTVGKPAQSFICVISGDCVSSFHGDHSGLSAVATLESIGTEDVERNRLVVKEVSEYVEREIGVKPSRFFLSFYDMKASSIGVRGTTLDVPNA